MAPAYMSWQRSGELLVMVLMGGVGTLQGAILGAAAFLMAEEVLSKLTEHWKAIFGPMITLIALVCARRPHAIPAAIGRGARP